MLDPGRISLDSPSVNLSSLKLTYRFKGKKCVLRREQFVWRLIDGKAEYVHYRIFDAADSTDLPPVDGARNGKCEYGLEILITLAYLVYWTGVSIDQACGILAFFTGLELSKSQAD